MTKQAIRQELETGAKAVKDFNGFCGIVRGGNWIADITKNQFAKLVADTTLKFEKTQGSVYVMEVKS